MWIEMFFIKYKFPIRIFVHHNIWIKRKISLLCYKHLFPFQACILISFYLKPQKNKSQKQSFSETNKVCETPDTKNYYYFSNWISCIVEKLWQQTTKELHNFHMLFNKHKQIRTIYTYTPSHNKYLINFMKIL